MTSDGITADSLLTIYRELYHRFEVLRKPRNIRLLPSRSVTTLKVVVWLEADGASSGSGQGEPGK